MKEHVRVAIRSQRRTYRVRRRLGSRDRCRLTVFRSNNHVYCQIIDDRIGKTIASACSQDDGIRSAVPKPDNCEVAFRVGQIVAARAISAGVNSVYFDRGPYAFHGRVEMLAKGARQGGLDF
jgi:large subunit ribosomal protein L18